MTPPTLQIAAASRLHFGLLSFGNPRVPAYGGVGLMVEQPALQLRIERAAAFEAVGPLAERVDQFARHWQRHTRQEELPNVCLQVLSAPCPHVGLGVGTQLGLCVGALLYAFTMSESALGTRSVETLAQSVGRGRRSSVGTHGFDRGGLLFELGKRNGQSLAELADRVELCPDWRVVLLRPRRGIGLSGEAENRAFQQLPAVPTDVTDQLIHEVQECMLPAARANDCEAFGESVYRYGVQAGMCFAQQQGGPFANPQLQDWVAAIRRRGIRGVGQSSWGPTLFALLPSQADAEELVAWCGHELAHRDAQIQPTISPIANHGARLTSGAA